MTPVQLGKARVVAHLVLRGGTLERRYPVRGGELTLLPGAGVLLREPGPDGALRDALRLDPETVKAASVGRMTRNSRVLEPWPEDDYPPSRLGQVVKGRRDLVLINAELTGPPAGEALWAFELWRGPSESVRARLNGLRERSDWPPSIEATVPAESLQLLIRTVRRQGGEANALEGPY